MNGLPDFLGIGTQKGGTTTLHKLLINHPSIYQPECKEVHYFDQNYEKTVNWYKEYFKGASSTQKIGEITPMYLYLPEAPKRIHKLLPQVKIIVLLRDPVERTLSHIFHARKRGYEKLEPEQAIEAEEERLNNKSMYSLQKHSYISRSKYIEQLDRYENLFRKEQILVLQSERLFKETQETWSAILEFLGIDDQKIGEKIPKENYGGRKHTEIDNDLRKKLQKRFEYTCEVVNKRYGIRWNW